MKSPEGESMGIVGGGGGEAKQSMYGASDSSKVKQWLHMRDCVWVG